MKKDKGQKRNIEEELRGEPSLSTERFETSVKSSVIEFKGHVFSRYQKWAADKAAFRGTDPKAVPGELKAEAGASGLRPEVTAMRAAPRF